MSETDEPAVKSGDPVYVPGEAVEVTRKTDYDALVLKVQELDGRVSDLEDETDRPTPPEPPTKPPVEPPPVEPPTGEWPVVYPQPEGTPPVGERVTAQAGSEIEEFDNLKDANKWLQSKGGGGITMAAGYYENYWPDDGSDSKIRHDTIIYCQPGVVCEWTRDTKLTKGWLVAVEDANLTVINAHVKNAVTYNSNGACIRNESDGEVICKGVTFEGRENGILGAQIVRPNGLLRIEGSLIQCNGKWQNGKTHNVYTGPVGRFEVINTRVRGVMWDGHELKIYARDTLIEDSVIGDIYGDDGKILECVKEDEGGGASNEIDMTAKKEQWSKQTLTVRNTHFIHNENARRNTMVEGNGSVDLCDQEWTFTDCKFENKRTSRSVTAVKADYGPATLTNCEFIGIAEECEGNCNVQ